MMEEQAANHLRAAIDAVAIRSSSSFTWFGTPSLDLPRFVSRTMTRDTARDLLLYALQSRLYSSYYCLGAPAQAEDEGMAAVVASPDLTAALESANSGCGCFEPGWQVKGSVGEFVSVSRNGLQLLAEASQCNGCDQPLEIGATVSVKFEKGLRNVSPGFYMAQGDEPLSAEASRDLVRLYWHVTPAGAVELMRQATAALNEGRLPFRLKALNRLERYRRCDAAVLYIRKADYSVMRPALQRIYAGVQTHINDATPAFTKRLAPGLALAEDPADGDSFGLNRSRILARALVHAHERRIHALEDKLELVAREFESDGIALSASHLNPGSTDEYAFTSTARRRVGQPSSAVGHTDCIDNATLARCAENFGALICDRALWHGEKCTWTGHVPLAPHARKGGARVVYGTLTADLYAGAAGVALFLIELYRYTGAPRAARTARAAIEHALGSIARLRTSERLAFYTGALGIAFVASRIGLVLADTALIERSSDVVRSLRDSRSSEPDLLTGTSGSIAGLLALHAMLDDPELLAMADVLGRELLANSTRSPIGRSWQSTANPSRHHLTGLSHGAAGAAFALLELYRLTHDSDYADAAEEAIQYEQHWFNPSVRNWPDFRVDPGTHRVKTGQASYGTSWCHGAPGIALSRLHAHAALQKEDYRMQALEALDTTGRTVADWLASGTANYSLCHGLAGNADILLEAARGTPSMTDAMLLVRQVAATGISTYGNANRPWPCGVGTGVTPGLMTGWAGIGYFYLRLVDPSVPSVLLPGAGQLRAIAHSTPPSSSLAIR